MKKRGQTLYTIGGIEKEKVMGIETIKMFTSLAAWNSGLTEDHEPVNLTKILDHAERECHHNLHPLYFLERFPIVGVLISIPAMIAIGALSTYYFAKTYFASPTEEETSLAYGYTTICLNQFLNICSLGILNNIGANRENIWFHRNEEQDILKTIIIAATWRRDEEGGLLLKRALRHLCEEQDLGVLALDLNPLYRLEKWPIIGLLASPFAMLATGALSTCYFAKAFFTDADSHYDLKQLYQAHRDSYAAVCLNQFFNICTLGTFNMSLFKNWVRAEAPTTDELS